jgi:hypothetical protein
MVPEKVARQPCTPGVSQKASHTPSAQPTSDGGPCKTISELPSTADNDKTAASSPGDGVGVGRGFVHAPLQSAFQYAPTNKW